MFICTVLAVSFAVSHAMTLPEFKDIEDVDRDITEINQALNISFGDVIVEKGQANATINQDQRWTSPVPYVLEKSLKMNAKGVILRAFDQYRIKTCIDFKPRDSEESYISVQKLDGCFSYVGLTSNQGQNLSIGEYCDKIDIVEHEFLHALGFWHEQSRYDRDDYVTVANANILKGKERNFDKITKEQSNTQDTMYDYNSVMHYGKNAFSNGNGSTIITKKPEFQDVIGQRLDMSPNDVLKLNRLYTCYSTIAFKEFCSFSDDLICGMSSCAQNNAVGWQRVTQALGGPYTDHTHLPSPGLSNAQNAKSPEHAFFMHVSTAFGLQGDSSWLQSRRMSPTRKCHVQCLQFYYFHTGHQSDQLNIWLREFQDDEDSTGKLRLMGQITGPPTFHWLLHHVPLNASNSFQVEFEVRNGAVYHSQGGFSIDDINLSETECPHQTWQIRDFERIFNASNNETFIFSPSYYSPEGYAYQVAMRPLGDKLRLYVRLVSGEYDDQLQWPCALRQVTFISLDQNPNIQLQMSRQRSLTTNPNETTNAGKLLWGNPQMVGNRTVDENNHTFYANGLFSNFIVYVKDMKTRDVLKGRDAIFLVNFQDISPLQNHSSLPCPKIPTLNFTFSMENRQGPCALRTTIDPPFTTDEDKSIFGWSPAMVSSPMILFSALLLLFIQ